MFHSDIRRWEAKVAVRDDLLNSLEAALALVPTGALSSGAQWMPSPEAVVIISIAKDRLAEFRRLHQ